MFGICSCSVVCLHTCRKNITTLKKTQYFVARICTKNWNAGYYDLLDILELPQLVQHRLHTRLTVLYVSDHGLLYFPHHKTQMECAEINAMREETAAI